MSVIVQTTMAEEGIILPDEPLLIVDRGYRSRRGSQRQQIPSSAQPTNRVNVLREPVVTDNPSASRRTSRQQSPRKSTMQYQFVAATEPDGRHDSAAQRLVRSHVRRQSNRPREAPGPGSAGREVSRTPSLSEGDGESRWKSPRGEQTPLMEVDQIIHQVTDMVLRVDDLSQLDNIEPLYPSLARAFYPPVAYVPFTRGPDQWPWFRLVMSDMLLLRAMLMTMSLINSHSGASTETPLVLQLRQSVIRELTARIGQPVISDATIAAVSCLALSERYLGNEDNWRLHHSGLNGMLEQKGGISNASQSLQILLYRTHISGSEDFHPEQRMPRPILPTAEVEPSSPISNLLLGYVMTNSGMNLALQNTFSAMCSVSKMIGTAIDSGVPLEQQHMDIQCIIISLDLLESYDVAAIGETYRLAGLVFMKTLIRSKPFTTHLSLGLASKLRYLLERVTSEVSVSKLFFWATMMAAMISKETEHASWILHLVARICRYMNCTTWPEFTDQMTDLPWVKAVHDRPASEILQAALAMHDK